MSADQIALFSDIPIDESKNVVKPPEFAKEWLSVKAELPSSVRMGTSSWSVPGWEHWVYAKKHTSTQLAKEGLKAYGQNPLFGCVGIDRTYYRPVQAQVLADYANSVPLNFKFMVKAHDHCTIRLFPNQQRYGKYQGQVNDRFLDPDYAEEFVVQPAVEGLGKKLGVVVFQFPPQAPNHLGGPRKFADSLYEFLVRLPKGPCYAIEVRNRELLSQSYGEALFAANVSHVKNVYPGMPAIEEQMNLEIHTLGPLVVGRWMLRPGLTYQEALAKYQPFAKIQEPDFKRREAYVSLLQAALNMKKPAILTVNNKAEGCSPESILELSRLLIRRS